MRGVSMLVNKKVLFSIAQEVGEDVFQGFIGIYVSDTEETIKAIKKAVQEKDYESLSLHIHTQKSVQATYGAEDATKLAISLNEKCKQKVPLSEITNEINDFLELLEKTKNEISKLTFEDLRNSK